MPIAVKMKELPPHQLFVELAERHGHYCPMSTLGLRVGWAALRRLRGEIQSATYYEKTCARDGIRLALNLESLDVEAQDKHLLRFSDGGNHWLIELLPKTLELAASYRLLTSDDGRDSLLERLRSADESELLQIIQERVAP